MVLDMNKEMTEASFRKRCFLMYFIVHIYMLIVRCVFYYIWPSSGQGNPFIMFDSYNIVYYALNYDNGFLSRALAGELFGKVVLSAGENIVYWSIIVKHIYSFIFFAILTYGIAKYSRDNNVLFLSVLLFMRPFYLNSSAMYVLKTDIFWYISLVFIVVLLWKDKNKYFGIKMLFVVLLSIIAMLFHQAFIFIFAPLVCAILIDKKEPAWFLVYGFSMCAVFICLTKFGQGDYDIICEQVIGNLEEAGIWPHIKDLSLKTSNGDLFSLYYEYNDSRLTQLKNSPELAALYLGNHLPVALIVMFASSWSIIASLTVINKYCDSVLNNYLLKQLLTGVFLIPFIALLLLTIDADRWALMTLTSLNIFSMYVAIKHKVDFSFMSRNILYPSLFIQLATYPFIVSVGA